MNATEDDDILDLDLDDEPETRDEGLPMIGGMAKFDIRHLSTEQLGTLGVSHMAYVKPVLVNGQRAFAIHGADGTPMAVAGDAVLAFAAIRQHEMIPALVH